MRISDWSSDVCSSDLILGGSTAAIFGAEEEAVQSGSNGQQSTARNNGAIITDSFLRDIEKITQDIVQRNQAVQPIITVPAGTRITVIPTMDIQMRPMVGRTEEVRSYPRQQNAGAPQGGYNQGSQGSGGNGGGNFGPKAISFDAPQPSQPQNGTPFPSAEVPSMGATPPWNSN